MHIHICGWYLQGLCGNFQPSGPAEVQCECFGPISGLNFGRWILGGEFLDGEFFRGPLFLEKIGPKTSTQAFGSEIRASKIRLAEFGPKFGLRRCKIPCAAICPWAIFCLGNLQKCVGGFLLYKFWRIFPGIFLEDFSGHFFPQKWGEKIRRENPRKNPAAQK